MVCSVLNHFGRIKQRSPAEFQQDELRDNENGPALPNSPRRDWYTPEHVCTATRLAHTPVGNSHG